MKFQPLGIPFDLRSLASPREVRRALRARKLGWFGWFSWKDGARGWILGPFMSLWLEPVDPRGPSLFGFISRDGAGTRLRGFAGWNLAPIYAILLFDLYLLGCVVVNGDLGDPEALLGLGLFGGLPMLLSHGLRGQARPLILFVQDVMTDTTWPDEETADTALDRPLTLNVNNDDLTGPVTARAIREALVSLPQMALMTATAAPETYLRTIVTLEGTYLLEKREGAYERHYQAVRADPAADPKAASMFTFEEVLAAFIAYATDSQSPAFLRWEHQRYPGPF